MAYRPRVLDNELDELLASLPAIAIEGAKGAGKTETASRRAATVHMLDDPDRLALAEADPKRLLESDPPILIDEWQRLPETWDLVRRAVDAGVEPGRFLLTGSASPEGAGMHSGAGRIPTIRMRPLSLHERVDSPGSVSLSELLEGRRPSLSGETDMALKDYTEEIVASGFPGLRDLSGRALRTQLDGYLTRIVDRDFAELGHELRNPAGLKRWMTAYAAASSTTTSFEKIRNAATGGEGEKPSKRGAAPYRNVLERLWILDPVPAWQPTRRHLSRLSASPKHHLADPALAARLLGASASSLLENRQLGPPIPRDGTLLGALFESLVTLCVRVYAQAAEAGVGHLRTFSGDREVDLIVQRQDGGVVAIEVKLKRTVQDKDCAHLEWLRSKLGDELLDALIVTTGDAAYRRADGIGIVPAALLEP
ncbi:MAG TPA: ATP-binding protein [Solirubrobacterales bacterium]|nr:ATP-binding protein [Solirubrobacterales bacterium]